MSTAVIYWSGTGNTQAMAQSIQEGLTAAGEQAVLLSVDQVGADVPDAYDRLALGCPSMGDEVLEESEFEPFFLGIEGKLAGKKVALFGSYGWGDGQWMRDWVQRTRDAGASLYGEGLIQQDAPDEDACVQYGKEFAAF